jgi:hypothetical protein
MSVELAATRTDDTRSSGARGGFVERVEELEAQVCHHPVFVRLRSMRALRVFMEHHVWAVWDFMSLLKSIQGEIAPVSVPWKPPADPESARLINEIVLAEEGDDGPDGHPISHFEVYLSAMRAAGASTLAIERFTTALDRSVSLSTALDDCGAPAAARRFVASTFEVIGQPLHCRVATFTRSRERVIPTMFKSAIAGLASQHGCGTADLGRFLWYLDRHVALDGDRHGPMAQRLYVRACLRDEQTRIESLAVVCRVLEHRLALWDAVLEAVAE